MLRKTTGSSKSDIFVKSSSGRQQKSLGKSSKKQRRAAKNVAKANADVGIDDGCKISVHEGRHEKSV